jgi:hypothetical protein
VTARLYREWPFLLQVSLALQAVLDNNEFKGDQTELDSLDFKNDLSEDYVMVRRLSITRNDPIRNMNLPEKVGILLFSACSHDTRQNAALGLKNKALSSQFWTYHVFI